MRQEELEKKIEEAAELANVYKYKSVFIAFSGHGGKKEDQSYIVSNDGVVIWLTDFVNHIVDLFGDEIPKIFLLDSCRGYTELEQRPKRVKRNYLIAYATQDDRVSMLKYDGSYWMPVVARYLREVDDTVVNVIIKANLHVQENHDLKYIQRPVLDDDNFYSGDLKIYQGTYIHVLCMNMNIYYLTCLYLYIGVEDTDKPPSAGYYKCLYFPFTIYN